MIVDLVHFENHFADPIIDHQSSFLASNPNFKESNRQKQEVGVEEIENERSIWYPYFKEFLIRPEQSRMCLFDLIF